MGKRRRTAWITSITGRAIPVRTEFDDPFQDPVLAQYLESVLRWHGYIRFVGLPRVGEYLDVGMDRLFVEPRLGAQRIAPEEDPAAWPKTQPVLDALEASPRLVVLGDPGSGKSTLVSWLAWQMARPHGSPCVARLGRLVPIPLVLRELPISRGITWEGLLEALLAHGMARGVLTPEALLPVLQRGQALVMLDGLDEIGDVAARESLHEAFLEGLEKYPSCRWLLTSRIVGYEAVPFQFVEGEDLHPMGPPSIITRPIADVMYAAPFNDQQVDEFARNWFTHREAVAERAEVGAGELLAAIRRDRATQSLARIPNLLTLMALIYRVQARLPHGRALLYDAVADAYLESIDEYRRLREMDLPLAQKKRWLARVGFEMQLRRASAGSTQEILADKADVQQEILADKADVEHWVLQAMGESGYGRDEARAAAFVDYIGRRSGLLLPRGEGQFAFMHLSFQEYFAAQFLSEQVTSPGWLKRRQAAHGTDPESLAQLAQAPLWRETLIFLFELLANRPGWPEELAEALFGPDFSRIGVVGPRYEAGVLLAHLAADPHSGLSDPMREAAIDRCCQAEMTFFRSSDLPFDLPEPRLFVALFSAEPTDLPRLWETIVRRAKERTLRGFSLSGSRVSDIGPLAGLTDVEHLDLSNTRVADLRPLARLTKLKRVFLADTPVTDLGPLAGLTNLETLTLIGTGVRDLGPVGALSNLETLAIFGTPVTDLAPLGRLNKLHGVYLDRIAQKDLTPLLSLPSLEWLYIMEEMPTTDVASLESRRKRLGLPAIEITVWGRPAYRPIFAPPQGERNLPRPGRPT